MAKVAKGKSNKTRNKARIKSLESRVTALELRLDGAEVPHKGLSLGFTDMPDVQFPVVSKKIEPEEGHTLGSLPNER